MENPFLCAICILLAQANPALSRTIKQSRRHRAVCFIHFYERSSPLSIRQKDSTIFYPHQPIQKTGDSSPDNILCFFADL